MWSSCRDHLAAGKASRVRRDDNATEIGKELSAVLVDTRTADIRWRQCRGCQGRPTRGVGKPTPIGSGAR